MIVGIGPPDTRFGGMNTTLRRQQIPLIGTTQFYKLRNVRLIEEALTRRNGIVRLMCGARTTNDLTSSGAADTWVAIPATDDNIAISDYTLGTEWTFFAAYKPVALDDDILLFASDTADPALQIVHGTSGKITVTVEDADGTVDTITSAGIYPKGYEWQVQVVRSGATVTLYIQGVADVTTGTLSATALMKAFSTSYMGSWSARPTGSNVTFYELRIHRKAITAETWRQTTYPRTGTFGDPNLALHLIFDDGSGTSLTDYSRNAHGSISLVGAGWTWGSSSTRQVATPVTGIHIQQTARGRKWILFDVGKNHYRAVVT